MRQAFIIFIMSRLTENFSILNETYFLPDGGITSLLENDHFSTA